MSYTKLSKEDKMRSLMYITNHEISKDKTIEKKQWEMLEVFFENYIKECDYSYVVRRICTEKYKGVYTFDWPDKMTLTELDLLLSNFAHRTEQYKKIHTALHDEYSKGYPTKAQTELVYNFKSLFQDWWVYDAEDFIDMYHSKYWLDRYVDAHFLMRNT